MDVFPDFGGVGAAGDLRAVIGALLMFVLIIAVLMLIVSAIVWAISSSTGNPHTATKARIHDANLANHLRRHHDTKRDASWNINRVAVESARTDITHIINNFL